MENNLIKIFEETVINKHDGTIINDLIKLNIINLTDLTKEIIKTNVASVSSSIYKCEIVLSNNENGVATKKIQIDKEPPQINEIIFDKSIYNVHSSFSW